MPAKNKNLKNVHPTLVLGDKQYSTEIKPEDLDEVPEPERPPLRPIDCYVKPECPCLSQRYTVAVLTCLGFVISFGMRCNMGMAKLQFEHYVSLFFFLFSEIKKKKKRKRIKKKQKKSH